MELSIYGLENPIIFDDEHINILEIDNKKLFVKILTLLNNKCNGIDTGNEIILKEENKELKINNNMFIVFDIFNIDFNSKKVLTKLYTNIAKNVDNSDDFELEKLIFEFRNLLVKEINEFPFEFTMKTDINVEEVLKMFSLKIDENCYIEVTEKIEFLIDVINELKLAKILVVPNLKDFLTNEELVEIYKYAKYNDIHLLIIQNYIEKNLLEYEKKNIIDSEFDDFIKKM